MASSSFNIENLENLLVNVARGNWMEVIEIYKEYPESHEVKIPESGDTAIHIAIANGLESISRSLVLLCQVEALAIGNVQGNTPLHLAAKVGSVRMCKCIAEKDSNLMGSRNENGETPLFVAVSHGRLSAFLCLHHICKQEQHQYRYYRRNNGDTILHSAISEEHFDIALDIIHLYGELVHTVNKDGMSPLHLLAGKPSSFPSGIHLIGLRKLAYHCISVGKREQRPPNYNYLRGYRESELSTINCPQNWATCINYFFCLGTVIRVLVCSNRQNWNSQQPDVENQLSGDLTVPGYEEMIKLRREKEKHIWSIKVLDLLLKANSRFPYKPYGMLLGGDNQDIILETMESPSVLDEMLREPPKDGGRKTIETPLLIAAKNGVVEIVEGILGVYPDAILDVNTEKKNIVMLAVENRHIPLYKFLLKDPKIMKTIFGQVDNEGNSVLHIAAAMPYRQSWRIPGAALQMHMEVKWYKFVKCSMPPRFFARYNFDHKTPGQIFKETHGELIYEGRQWLIDNAQSCSLVAALVATVAFATSATIPGGVKQDSGTPTLENKPIFIISAVASLIALCFSMISVVMFLGILTSSFKQKDFHKDLPRKLLLGLISLLVSIVSMLVSFFAGHHFVLKQELKHSATLVYALFCLPLVVFIIAKFPLNFEIVWTTLKKEPQQCSK